MPNPGIIEKMVTGTRTAAEAPGIVSKEVLILQDISHVAGFTSLGFAGGLAYSYYWAATSDAAPSAV